MRTSSVNAWYRELSSIERIDVTRMLLKKRPKVNRKRDVQRQRQPGYWGAGCLLKSVLFILGSLCISQLSYAMDFFGYLDELHARSTDKALHQNRTWLYLLHYYPAEIGSNSDITDERFFLSENGSRDPKDELYETLEAIFDPVFEKGDRHGQCLFRARFHWLDQQLNFDRRYLPKVNCRKYDYWRNLISAQSISLVFASAFMDNPGSVYGHTFLKINREKGGTRLNLLDHVIQYQALPEDQIGILYAIKGIFGGYKGLYPLDPYYIPIQNNIEFEDRSIWEYELNLTDEQMELLLTHSWELAHFYTDYYFFKQNCAYRILELIEIAAPQYQFKDRFLFWAMPSQAVVYALTEKGLIRHTNYFPARTRQLMQKFEGLDDVEKEVLLSVIRNPETLQLNQFLSLTVESQVRVLDTALDYLRSRVNKNRDDPENAVHRRTILLARSKLGKSKSNTTSRPDEQSIHLGHGPARFQAAAGSMNNKSFVEIALRPSYHDLLADETGHLKNSHFTTFDIYLRLYEDDWALHELEFIQLFDLAPNNMISDDWSWRLKIGIYPSTAESCVQCRKSQLQMAFGRSRYFFSGSASVYLMGHGAAEADSKYDQDYMLGAGLDAGILLQISDIWKLQLEVTGTGGILGEQHAYVRETLQQRWRLGRDRDIRLNWTHQMEHEIKLAMNWYF